jgi:hypothetical protein
MLLVVGPPFLAQGAVVIVLKLDLQLHMQSVQSMLITTNIVSSNLAHG